MKYLNFAKIVAFAVAKKYYLLPVAVLSLTTSVWLTVSLASHKSPAAKTQIPTASSGQKQDTSSNTQQSTESTSSQPATEPSATSPATSTPSSNSPQAAPVVRTLSFSPATVDVYRNVPSISTIGITASDGAAISLPTGNVPLINVGPTGYNANLIGYVDPGSTAAGTYNVNYTAYDAQHHAYTGTLRVVLHDYSDFTAKIPEAPWVNYWGAMLPHFNVEAQNNISDDPTPLSMIVEPTNATCDFTSGELTQADTLVTCTVTDPHYVSTVNVNVTNGYRTETIPLSLVIAP